MPISLPELQAAFAAALEDEDAGELDTLVRANGLAPGQRVAVYRNNTRLTQLEALAGIYPAVQRLLGEEFFAHMADLFAAMFPSRSGDLRRFGGELAEFLEGFPPTASLAYLPGVGYPADRPLRPITRPNRRPFDQVVHHGHW